MVKRILRRLASDLRLIGKKEKVVPGEQAAFFYDRLYAESEEYLLPYRQLRYYFVWTVILDRIRRSGGARSVLEIGCGSAQLAEMLIDHGLESYVGLDFSAKSIEFAKDKHIPRTRFIIDDARTSDVFTGTRCDVVICTEVLEHIEDDLLVLSRFPIGARCVCSVPNFPFKSHVRHFLDVSAVASRYERYFDEFDVLRLERPEPDCAGKYYFLFDGVRNTHVLEDDESEFPLANSHYRLIAPEK